MKVANEKLEIPKDKIILLDLNYTLISPIFITEYIEKTFLSNYKSYLYYLKKTHKNKLDDTNNKTEGYFRATMPRSKKKIPHS